jgi:hypothetical protein
VPLRSAERIGMTDPRQLTADRATAATTPVTEPTASATQTKSRRQSPPDPRSLKAASPLAVAAPETVPDVEQAPATNRTSNDVGERRNDESETERAFVQILVPPDLAKRMARASLHLKHSAYKARFQQTIMGAMLEQLIPDPDDPAVISAGASLIARWRRDPLSELRGSRRVGWYLPLELTAKLDQLVLNLKEQHYRLRPSATSLLAAVIWLELDPDTVQGQVALEQLAVSYHQRWEQPDYDAVAA